MSLEYRHCPLCATHLQPSSMGGRLRLHCPSCGWIHYRNPTVGVAVVLLEAGKLLLGKRQDGGWCIPCGHVEWDETIEQAALREYLEETGLQVDLTGILAVKSNFHDPEHHTVGVWYWGRRRTGNLRPGGDLVQVDFFLLDELPDLKFPTDREVVASLRQL
ncbi:MAG: NUDIX hydrolase [Anaerolineales bacterium]|nr:MAG: NUDIX hydrolase [Anaerolineales bacterium]